jgi:uncharacterized spore protein YtfJ
MPNVDEILRGAREAMSVTRVYGEPVERDGVTIVPVAAVRGGGGGGGDDTDNGGAGFGLSASPVGAYVIKDGAVSWKPAVDVNRIMLGWQLVALAALLIRRSRRGRPAA